jgi:D-arabinose 1-dehydrogenase-like Zn-dependent alcohol dehydrogenase
MEEAKAAVLTGPNIPFKIRTFPLPRVEKGGILLKVQMATICGTDIHIFHGRRSVPFPSILGHEGVGEICTLGEGVEKDAAGNPINVGDRVIFSHIIACGKCFYCVVRQDPQGCLKRKYYGYASCKDPPYINGTYSEYIYLDPGTPIFNVPENLPNIAVSPATCALITMIEGMETVKVDIGDDVVVQGAGALGLYGIALAKEMGAYKVIAIEKSDFRIKQAEEFGADYIVDLKVFKTPEERVKKVKELTNGFGPDLILECTGVPSVISEGLEMAKDPSRYLLIGTASESGTVAINPVRVTLKRIRLYGGKAAAVHNINLYKALRFLERNIDKYPFSKIVSHEFELSKVNDAMQMMARGEIGKVALIP